ncbi:MAG: polysaccharide pyruvyl transferase family protein [Acetobacteraceae bacterium]|jgi:polysaccharide pyruvyl transferase WcaK-like protein|nr:polysaccharide pyruvyl transferase family protein [Acetobacteraceae bacterium]
MERARVFVLQGYYGTGNFGDDWLLAASIAALAAASPGARFIVRDHGDAIAIAAQSCVTFTGSERVLGDAASSRAARLWRYATEAWRQFGRADWLVFGGGTQFHAGGGVASLALNALLCLLARLRGVRVALLGCGIKEIDGPLARALLAFVIRSAHVVVVRDAASRAIAGPRALLAADLAFTAPLPRPAARGDSLALAVYPPAWTDALADAIGRAAATRPVVLLTVQREGVTRGDEAALGDLAARLGRAVARRDLVDPAAAFAGVGLVCGMRFHALLAAAQAGLPFVGIAHDPKIADLCTRFSMPFLDPDTLTAEALTAALETAAALRPSDAALARCRAEAEHGLSAMAEALA